MMGAIQERHELPDGTVIEQVFVPRTQDTIYRTESGRRIERYQYKLLINQDTVSKKQ